MLLNCHTFFSFKFGTMSPEALLQEVTSKGADKFVLSDVNNTSGILETFRLTKGSSAEYAARPVAGIDFRNGVQQKFIGIAKNHHGFFELNRMLTNYLNESAGLTGRLGKIPDRAPELEDAFIIYPFAAATQPSFISGGKLKKHEFIGIKPSDLNRLKFSEWRYHPEKLVVLAPVTFRNKVDFNCHRLLRAIDNNIVLSKLPVSEQASADEIMMRTEELHAAYKDFPHLVRNTQTLLDECEVIDFRFEHDKNKRSFTGSIETDRELLMKLCDEGMTYRYPESGDAITTRFKKEIDLITEKTFTSYFLINWDIVHYARHKNYFYVGRGSGANSMVAYLLGITDVDPIDLDLYFERFINPSRKNPPDFDIDFSSDERDDVIGHIFEKHGKEYTALLATYSEMKDNAVMRELGKVFGLPKAEIDALLDNKNHPETPDHITRMIHQYGNLLYSFPSHLSIHAGGILISDQPIEYYTALSNPPKGFPLTQFSMLEAEDVGFAKFDILSQRGLGKVRDAVDLIRQNKKVEIDIHDVKRFMKDPQVSDNLKYAKLMGCFYVESPAMRMLLTKLKASTYLDLVAASSIIRPGVAQSGMMQEYIRRFHEPDHGKSRAIPEMWELMEDTFGVMVYQEDVIKVAHFFGKLTLGEADKLRRGMGGKYRGRQEFLEVKDQFLSNCRELGYDEKLINDVWFQMETFGGYAFAKGHSASYAVESYQCMFLKTYYPLEYLVAVINNGGGFFRREYYIHEARMLGATIHAPDINHSEVLTRVREKDIYLGFDLMKELEKNTMEAIVSERNRDGHFSSLNDFMKRVSVSAEQLRILIRIGAFRFTGKTKHQLLWDIYAVLGHKKKSEARRELFAAGYKNFVLPELFNDPFQDARDELEILDFPLRASFSLIQQPLPSNLVAADFKKYEGKIIEIVGYYVTYKPTSTKKGEAMMFGCFLDRAGHFFDTNHFPEATRKFPFRGKGCYLIKGKVAEEFGFYSINVLEMHLLNYVMFDDDAETIARSRPDPPVTAVVIPSPKKYNYLLVISPPPQVRDEVMLWKKRFHRQFDHPLAIKTKPHITLCTFSENEAKEAGVLKHIAAVSLQHSSFRLSLEDFGGFPDGHAVFLQVRNPGRVGDIVRDLKKELQSVLKGARFITRSHLTIARDLDQEKFSRAHAEFSKLHYAASFTVSNMVLLRKEEKTFKYEIAREFMLEGKKGRA